MDPIATESAQTVRFLLRFFGKATGGMRCSATNWAVLRWTPSRSCRGESRGKWKWRKDFE